MSHTKVILWQYPSGFDLPSLSPFCFKVEACLRLLGQPYTVKVTNNPLRGPFGKFPVLDFADQRIPDSRFIVDALNQHHGGGLDRHLTGKQKAHAHAVSRMIEEHLYFVIMYSRWVEPQGFQACGRQFASAFPFGLRRVALFALRALLKRQCRAQGLGRLNRERIYQLGVRDVEVLESLLESDFLFGEVPTSVDCTAYAFLKTIHNFPVGNPVQEAIVRSNRLQRYISDMEGRCGI